MVDEPTQDQRPEFAVRPGDEIWLNGLPRAKENVKHDWKAIHCLVTQRRADGIAPIVLETTEGQCLRPPAKYEGAFELCLRHLHGRRTPLEGECTVGALLSNRAAHALKLPGRWVPLPDGVVEDRAAQSAPPEDGGPAATSGGKDPSSADEEADASSPPEDSARAPTPEGGTGSPASDEERHFSPGGWAERAPEPNAEKDDEENDGICVGGVTSEEEESASWLEAPEPSNAEEALDTDEPSPALEGSWQEEGGEDGATGLCAEEGDASSQGGEPEPPQAEEVSCTDETSPALEGVCGTPRPGASVEDESEQGAAACRRRRRGRQGRDAQVAHMAWWSEDAWRQGGEPWRNPRGSQCWRSGHAWRPRV